MRAIDQVLTTAELEEIRTLIRRSRVAEGAASAQGAARQVKASQQLECSPEDQQRLVEIVFGALHRHREFSRLALPLELSVPVVNRYSAGMTYGAHYDMPLMPTPDGPRIRGDLSATLFLSDPADYDGGELCFTRVGSEGRVKLKAGDLFLHPASTLHSVAPVTRGERLAVVFWIQSMIREHEKREMVVELDGLVGRVAERMPGSTEVRDLTGVVGNLIRMWGELVVALAVILGAAVAHSEVALSWPAVVAAPVPALAPPRGVEEVADNRAAAERVDRLPLVASIRRAPRRAPGSRGARASFRAPPISRASPSPAPRSPHAFTTGRWGFFRPRVFPMTKQPRIRRRSWRPSSSCAKGSASTSTPNHHRGTS